MRLILLGLCLLVAMPAGAAAPGLPARLAAPEDSEVWRQARDAVQRLKQGSIAYDPAQGRRVQQWAKKAEADIEEELK